jgi:hypothetical protein
MLRNNCLAKILFLTKRKVLEDWKTDLL